MFDMTALQWTNYYNATAEPYLAPSAVAVQYAAGSRYPSTWSGNDLEDLFLKPTSKPSAQTQPSASASPQQEMPHRRDHTKPVAGGAIGDVAAVALVGLVLYLFVRRRAKAKSRELEESKMPPLYYGGQPDPMKVYPKWGKGSLMSQTRGKGSPTRRIRGRLTSCWAL